MTSAFYKYILTTMVRATPSLSHPIFTCSSVPLDVQKAGEQKSGKNKEEEGDDG